MKKSFQLLSAALIALASFVPAQAATLLVNDGTNTNYNVPIEGQYADTEGCAVQTIYPEAQVAPMTGAFITSMTFYIADANGNALDGGKLAVSVGTTTTNSFPSYNPSVLTGLTHVADVTMTPGETEVVVNFDTPFQYEGGNLVVEFLVSEATSNYAYVNFYGVAAGENNACIKHNYSSSADAFYPKTTFEYEAVEDMASISAQALTFGNLYLEQTATQTFTLKNMGQNAFTPVFGALNAPFSIAPAAAQIAAGETVEYTVTFAPAALGEYAQTLTIDCGAAGQFKVAISGACVEVPAEVVVCDGTNTSTNLPAYGYYYDEAFQTQMIYPAAELSELAGKKIEKITFHPTQAITYNGGKMQLSFKAVDVDAFTSYDKLTDFTVVGTLVPTVGDTELTFVLDEPYLYEGGNLAIECLLLEAGSNYPNISYYGKNMTANVSLYYYGRSNSSAVSQFLPKATFGYVKEDAPVVVVGDVDGNGEVNITDVTLFISAVMNDNYSNINTANADMDGNGELNITDVTTLIAKVLNM